MKQLLYVLALLALPLTGFAQDDDFGVWTSAGIESKINKKWSVGADMEFRTRDDASELDRWSLGISTSYKFTRWLKGSVGASLLDSHRDKTTYYADGSPEYTANYWSKRYRVNVSLTGDTHFGRLQVSLRERWQYTYRPSQWVYRFDVDNDEYEDDAHEYRGKGKNVLRSRLQFDYDIPRCKVDPYANVEFFNAWSVEKIRYTIGAEWNITKQHKLSIDYKYQDSRGGNDFDGEPNRHILGIEYTYKL